jgi:hypothetical protein
MSVDDSKRTHEHFALVLVLRLAGKNASFDCEVAIFFGGWHSNHQPIPNQTPSLETLEIRVDTALAEITEPEKSTSRLLVFSLGRFGHDGRSCCRRGSPDALLSVSASGRLGGARPASIAARRAALVLTVLRPLRCPGQDGAAAWVCRHAALRRVKAPPRGAGDKSRHVAETARRGAYEDAPDPKGRSVLKYSHR